MRRNVVMEVTGLMVVPAKIHRRSGKHSLLQPSCVSTVDLLVIEQVIAEVEDAISAKGDIIQVSVTKQ